MSVAGGARDCCIARDRQCYEPEGISQARLEEAESHLSQSLMNLESPADWGGGKTCSGRSTRHYILQSNRTSTRKLHQACILPKVGYDMCYLLTFFISFSSAMMTKWSMSLPAKYIPRSPLSALHEAIIISLAPWEVGITRFRRGDQSKHAICIMRSAVGLAC